MLIRNLIIFFTIIFYSFSFAQFVIHHNPVFMPNISQPAAGSPITEPRFGTTIERITNARSSLRAGTFPEYAKREAWNSDDSLLFLIDDAGYTLLFDGETYDFIREISGVYGEDIFWHPTDPTVMFCVQDNSLYSYDVADDEFTLLHAFADYDWFNTRGEGNLSNNGRYYAFVGQDYDTMVYFRDIVVYDVLLDSVIAIMPLPEALSDFDWVSISPLGNYVVVDYATANVGRYEGIEVYDRNMNFIWQKPLGSGHSDIGIDGDGNEALIMAYYDSDSNRNYIKKFRLSDGAETVLLDFEWSFDCHISCRNTSRREWCFVSTFDGEGRLTDDSLSWLPFEDEIFALKLDGSGDVQRLAHHHSKRFSPTTPDPDNSMYWAEPHATVSRDGGRMLFGSNWRLHMEQDTSVDAYVVDFRHMIGIEEKQVMKPSQIQISAYPNPFNSSISITLNCHSCESRNPEKVRARRVVPLQTNDVGVFEKAPVVIEIFDLNGRCVWKTSLGGQNGSVADERRRLNGQGAALWTPGKSIPSGIYLVRATTEYGMTATKRVVYLK